MGVVNVTDDSFSDGGRYLDADRAVEQGLALAADGASIVDVGGESTRPGATRIDPQVETARVVPVVKELAAHGITVSIDTMHAGVARAALENGASMVNDVSGGRADDEMLPVVARLGTPYVLMHWRAHSREMQRHTRYGDVVADVLTELRHQLEVAVRAGVDPRRIAVDPGIGFSKTADQNWDVLAGLERLHELEQPVLVATSRKRFLGALLADASGELRPADQREDATTATSALASVAGAWCIRTHSVRPTMDAVRVAVRWAAAPARAEASRG
jgi:dihydropteroate synthase